MTREETLAYQRGYWAGGHNRWPAHKPPAPPDAVVAEVVAALRELRDAVDSLLATLSSDDEWDHALSPMIDRADAAMAGITHWLKEKERG